MSWYWLVAVALGGWTLFSIALGLVLGRVIAAAMNAGHDALTMEDHAALDQAGYAEALEVPQTASANEAQLSGTRKRYQVGGNPPS